MNLGFMVQDGAEMCDANLVEHQPDLSTIPHSRTFCAMSAIHSRTPFPAKAYAFR